MLLSNINFDCELFTCSNYNCSLDIHRRGIGKFCNLIIQPCMFAAEKCSPMATIGDRLAPEWNDQVKPEREQSLCGTGCG